MVKEVYKNNARHIQADLDWLKEVIQRRYNERKNKVQFKMPNAPQPGGASPYKLIQQQFKFNAGDRLVMLLALIPHTTPYFLDEAWYEMSGAEEAIKKLMPKPGAASSVDFALYLLAGDDLEKRFFYQQMFDDDAFFMKNRIITLDQEASGNSLQQILKISPDYLSIITSGKPYKPRFSTSFPAKQITTDLDWDDLILNAHIKDQVSEIKTWTLHGKTILDEWGLGKRLSPGYKVLFFGVPGTGKTLTAALLGKEAEVDVYRIDLSMVVSKYIGETEKNLSKIFDEADQKEWILFFDEADALFGKRTEMKDAHDRYANQEVAFLLQKIEDHDGIVILSSNMKANIDEAFTRRFQSIIYFPMPTATERLKIWKNGFSKKSMLEEKNILERIAEKYEMSGGAIMNVIRFSSMKALEKKKNVIEIKDLMTGIAREFAKEGRTI